jgi:hypothetical protein
MKNSQTIPLANKIFTDIVEVPNSQRISCLGRVDACDAGDPGSIPGGVKLNNCPTGYSHF